MKLQDLNDRKHRLLILLAILFVMQTLLGVAGLAAEEVNGGIAGAGETHHEEAFGLDPASTEDDEREGQDECRSPCDQVGCECAFCGQSSSQILPAIIIVRQPPVCSWSIAMPARAPSRLHSTVYRPPII
jgi:hypothetical protein